MIAKWISPRAARDVVDFREASEASGDVVIVAVVAPEDRSGPCRSVRHLNRQLALTSQKGQDLFMKSVGDPL